MLVANAVKHSWLPAALHSTEEDSIDSGVPGPNSLRLGSGPNGNYEPFLDSPMAMYLAKS